MSSLRAVYNRWMPVGTPGYNPQLFVGVHTRVVSQTKRALRGWQMEKLLRAENDDLTREERRALAYFRLMFLYTVYRPCPSAQAGFAGGISGLSPS